MRKIILVVSLLFLFISFSTIAEASRDTIKVTGETTLFSEDFEGYDDSYITLKKAYNRRLDNFMNGTIFHECEAYLNSALVSGYESENAALTCERIASSQIRNFAIELPRSKCFEDGTIHIRMNIKPQASITQRFDVFEGNDKTDGMPVLSNENLASYKGEWLDFEMLINLDNKTYSKNLKKASNGSVIFNENGSYPYDSVGGVYLYLDKGNITDSWSNKAPIVDNIYIGKITREADKNVFAVESFTYTDNEGTPLASINGATTINAKLGLKTGYSITEDAKIYLAVYSSDHRLKALNEAPKQFSEGYSDVTVSVNLKSACSEGEKAYIYIWENNSIEPLFNKYDIDVKLNVDDVQNGFDMHNDTLKAYLNDTYSSCVSKYADGSKELDKPLPITIKWTSGEGFKYILRVSENADMTNPWEYETYKNSYDVYNLKVGTKYYYTVTAVSEDSEIYTSEVKNFTTNDRAPRLLYVEGGMANFRDIGGWSTSDGKKVQQGLLFRSRAFEYISSSELKTSVNKLGIEDVTTRLGIKTEIDFRSAGEDSSFSAGNKNTINIKYYQIPLNTKDDYLSQNKVAIGMIFNILAYDENYPIDYHCVSGADRTGMISWLINALAGVSKEDLYRDYLLTNFHVNSVSRDVSKISEKYVKTLDNYTGANLQQKTYNYLANEIGVPTEKLDHIIYILKNGLGETPHYISDDVVEPEITGTVILDEDFEEPVTANSNYATEGGWVLDVRNGDTMTGYGSGFNSDTGFYPTWRAGHRTWINETRRSEYYLSADNSKTSGKYTIRFDFFKGSNAGNNPIRIGSGREYSDSTSVKIVDLYASSYATNNQWENVEIEIDLDSNKYSYTITTIMGTTLKSGNGTYNFDSVDYISFQVKANNSIGYADNTDISGKYSKIDNLKIVYDAGE